MNLVEVSHGKPRPRPMRADRAPRSPAAELAAPYRDPCTGRFGTGNPGGRLRAVAALGKLEAESLLRLGADTVAPWLRAHLKAAQEHVQQLIDALPNPTPELCALAGDEGKARLLAAAALAEGARDGVAPDVAAKWREEARAWMREARQTVLVRNSIAKQTPALPAEDPYERIRREGREATERYNAEKAARLAAQNAEAAE